MTLTVWKSIIAAALAVVMLAGCTGGGAAAIGRGLELAETRIGRITQFNDAKLQGCLSIADEMRRAIIDEIEAKNFDQVDKLLGQYRTLMGACRPVTLVERGKEIFGDDAE